MGLCAGSILGFLFRKYTYYASGDFMMNDGLVIFANNVDAKFLLEEVSGSRAEGEN
jgi:hypothetical protein